jgi:hypothetical protein
VKPLVATGIPENIFIPDAWHCNEQPKFPVLSELKILKPSGEQTNGVSNDNE